MRSRHPDERDETIGRRGRRPTRMQRPTGEEEEWDEAGNEQAETPRRKAPRNRRRRLETKEDGLDPPPNSSPTWLPPARR
jgi:hypothetical protein